MKKALLSDIHFHKWNAFSGINDHEVSTRLQIIIDEMSRAAETLLAAGGRRMYLAGDLFHVRGSVAPTVLNPVRDAIREIRSQGVNIVAIAGNHDLESADSKALTNAARALHDLGCDIIDSAPMFYADDNTLLIPWREDPAQLLEELQSLAKHYGSHAGHIDVIIHAPVNGVLMGMPDHGLNAVDLASLGFRRVFSGHYHDHKVLAGGKVISVGATTHQTWSDIGTKAGFLLFDDNIVQHVESQAPKFIDLARIEDHTKVYEAIRGNYARLDLAVDDHKAIDAIRQELLANGALGVVIKPIKKDKEVAREAIAAGSLVTMEGSIKAFVDARHGGDPELYTLCLEILNEGEVIA